jgi:hypothetical protein
MGCPKLCSWCSAACWRCRTLGKQLPAGRQHTLEEGPQALGLLLCVPLCRTHSSLHCYLLEVSPAMAHLDILYCCPDTPDACQLLLRHCTQQVVGGALWQLCVDEGVFVQVCYCLIRQVHQAVNAFAEQPDDLQVRHGIIQLHTVTS